MTQQGIARDAFVAVNRLQRVSALVLSVTVVAVGLLCMAIAGADAAHAAKAVDPGSFGTFSSTPALGQTFRNPGGVAVRHSTGQIYVFDTQNFRIQRFSETGAFERAWGWDVIQSGAPGDTGTGFEICTVAANCKAGVDGTGAGQFGDATQPQGLAIDQGTGAVYATDARNRRFQKFDADGNFLRLMGRNVVAAGSGQADERQRITVDATGGSYTLTFIGQTTAPIAAGATAATVQAALEALSNLDPGDVTVSGGPGGAGGSDPYVVDFAGTQANSNLPQMSATASVTGGAGSVAIATLVDGNLGFEVCVPASGDSCQTGEDGELAGELRANANTIAVDSSGDVLVGESSNRRVQKYDSSGAPIRAWGWDVVLSGPGNVGTGSEQQLVTINATGGSFTLTFQGNTTDPIPYNTDAAGIEQELSELPRGSSATLARNFAVSGTAGTPTAAGGPFTVTYTNELARTDFPLLTADGSALIGGASTVTVAPVSDGSSYEVCVVAVGDTCQGGMRGNVEVGKFDASSVPSLFLATDTSDRVFVSDHDAGRVQRFEPDGTSPQVFASEHLSSTGSGDRPLQIAIDPVDNHLYAVKLSSGGVERQVKEILPDGKLAPDGIHAQNAGIESTNGIAVDAGADAAPPNDGDIYLTSTQVRHWVLVLDEDGGLTPPTSTMQAASNVDFHSAQLNASINPNGSETSYRFEYSLDSVDWTPVGDFQSVGSGSSPVSVSAVASDLQANAKYSARVVTRTVFVGETTSSDITFNTLVPPGPTVTTGAAQLVTSGSADVRGRINPNNSPTTYHVEYGPTAAYGSTAPASGEFSAGTGGVDKIFVVRLSGLQPNTTYHYRFVATNGLGTDAGADRTFTTRPASAPCNCNRAYEMVTPPDKTGRSGGQPSRVESPYAGIPSADGESLLAVSRWTQLESGPDSSIPHSFNPLLLSRQPDGWKGQPLNNILPDEPSVAGLSNRSGISPDLGVLAWQHAEWFFDSKSPLGTRRFGDTGGSIPGSGWYDWLGAGYDWQADPAEKVTGSIQVDAALLTDGGGAMVRWGGVATTYRGLLGSTPAEDPSNTQLTGLPGGDAIYRQVPAGTGGRELVNECTGTGVDATRIPAIGDNGTPSNATDDTISSQACTDGSVTSKRGAAVGGGNFGPTGSPVAGPLRRALSEDGNRVIFTSPDPHAAGVPSSCAGLPAVGAGTDCPPQLFMRQYAPDGTARVRWISRSAIANQAATLFGSGVGYEGASADGRVVYFKTNAPLTSDDPNGTGTPGPKTTGTASDSSWDLYRYELPAGPDPDPGAGSLLRISGGPGGASDPNVTDLTAVSSRGAGALRFVSDDGQRAYFVTRGLIGGPADPWNEAPSGGVTDPAGPGSTATRNLYLFDATKAGDARWKFVAQLPFGFDGVDACASNYARSGMPQNASDDEDPVHPSIPALGRSLASCVHGAPSGSALVFETKGQLTGDDEDQAGDIYLYDAVSDELTRVSAPGSDGGYLCNAENDERCNATLGRIAPLGSDYETVGLNGAQNQNVSIDGNGEISVFFESKLPLAAADVNGLHADVFRWRAGEVSLISPGSSPNGAFFSGNTTDGEDVFFMTAEPIDAREIDKDFDLYDARVGGGIPLPPDGSPTCDPLSDECQAAGGGSSVGDDSQTGQSGGGNVDPGQRVSLRLLRPSGQALRRAARTGVLVIKVKTSAAGSVRVAARARIGGRSRGVGAVRKRLNRAGTATVKLRLKRSALVVLRRKGALRLDLSASARNAKKRSLTLELRRGRR